MSAWSVKTKCSCWALLARGGICWPQWAVVGERKQALCRRDKGAQTGGKVYKGSHEFLGCIYIRLFITPHPVWAVFTCTVHVCPAMMLLAWDQSLLLLSEGCGRSREQLKITFGHHMVRWSLEHSHWQIMVLRCKASAKVCVFQI